MVPQVGARSYKYCYQERPFERMETARSENSCFFRKIVEMRTIVTFEDLQTTLLAIRDFNGTASDFKVLMPDILNDQEGVNMAMITDAILQKDWVPDGYEQKENYRLYAYSEM